MRESNEALRRDDKVPPSFRDQTHSMVIACHGNYWFLVYEERT